MRGHEDWRLMHAQSGTYTSTLARSSSGKELLLSFRKILHALQGFFFRNNGATWALDLEFSDVLFSFHHSPVILPRAFKSVNSQPKVNLQESRRDEIFIDTSRTN